MITLLAAGAAAFYWLSRRTSAAVQATSPPSPEARNTGAAVSIRKPAAVKTPTAADLLQLEIERPDAPGLSDLRRPSVGAIPWRGPAAPSVDVFNLDWPDRPGTPGEPAFDIQEPDVVRDLRKGAADLDVGIDAAGAAGAAFAIVSSPFARKEGQRASGLQASGLLLGAVFAPSPASIAAAAMAFASISGASTDIGDNIGMLLAYSRDVRIPEGTYPALDKWRRNMRIYTPTNPKGHLIDLKIRKGIAHWLDIPAKAPREQIRDAVLAWPDTSPADVEKANATLAAATLKRDLPE